jgi:hypothetical protein
MIAALSNAAEKQRWDQGKRCWHSISWPGEMKADMRCVVMLREVGLAEAQKMHKMQVL